MNGVLVSREVEQLLGVRYWTLVSLIRAKKIDPAPRKTASGFYLWTSGDVQRAREALKNHRPRKYVPTPQAVGE
jgi:hypothetical protein